MCALLPDNESTNGELRIQDVSIGGNYLHRAAMGIDALLPRGWWAGAKVNWETLGKASI